MDSALNFTFFQNRLPSSSFCTFEEMRRNGELTDFKISFGSRCIIGHRLVVAAAIPYLRTAFTSFSGDITLEEVEPDVLEIVVDFAYSGRIQITYENVPSLLSASKFLQLHEVHSACWEYLEKMLHTNNAWEIRTIAENHLRSEVTAVVDDYIRQNFEEFSECEEFLDLPYSYLKDLFSRDDVKVSTEEKVFEALIRWVKVSPSERTLFLPDLLNNVRFTFLSTEYLKERVLCEEVVINSIPSKLLVLEAERYRMLPSESKPLCTQPRIYEKEVPQYVCSNSGIYAVCKSKSDISVKLFDTRSENWVHLSTFTHNFLDNAIAFNETIYIFLRETILTLDVNTLTWHLLDSVHDPTYSSGILVHKNKLFLFGGDEDLADSVRCFDPQLEKWLPEEKMVKCCENPGVAALGDYIYVTGGNFEGDVYRSSERYDPRTKEWSQISKMLSERVSHGCASLNGKIYVYGGYSDDYKNLETGEVYDPVMNQWSFISTMKKVSWRISLISNNGKLYALERMPTCPNKPTDVQIYDPECDQWKFGVPILQKGICEIFLILAVTSKVKSGNNFEEASDDDDGPSLIKRTGSDDDETSDDADWTTIDDTEESDAADWATRDETSDKDSTPSSDEF